MFSERDPYCQYSFLHTQKTNIKKLLSSSFVVADEKM